MTELKLVVSNSQLSVWQDCEQKWAYSYIDKLVPDKPTRSQEMGLLFHELAAVYDQFVMQGVPPGSKIAWEKVYKYALEDWPSMDVEELPVELVNRVIHAIKRYILEFTPRVDKNAKYLGVEDHFEVDFVSPKGREFAIQGYIDRIQTQDGRFTIVDRKTSSTGKHFTEAELAIDRQQSLYSAIYRELGHRKVDVAIHSVSTYPYKDYQAQPIDKVMKLVDGYRSPVEMDNIIINVGHTVDKILDTVEAGGPFVKNLSRDCVRCRFYDLCYYNMKGFDLEPIISANFKRKEE